jgi:tetratricopeptide (TPR) repeat protein
MKNTWTSLAAVCVLVIGVYAYMVQSGTLLELWTPNAADAYYNLLVQGFRARQLSLKKEVPPGLAELADPYDPAASAVYQAPPYRMLDLSYYRGRLYLYFGVTPALILFWPYVALTGHYLFHRQAVIIFCAMGFLVSVGLLRALWRRYFAEVNVGVIAACALALGLATSVPALLSHSDVYEVAISCGYMLTMLALAAIWCALHEPRRRSGWLAAASVAYGLAVGARPSLLFGAIILLVPVVHAWRERRQVWAVLMAAIGPILLIGLGLMLYNALRFDNPFEFGMRYQLNGLGEATRQFFSLHYLWFNFRIYFLEPARWSVRFPFVHEIVVPSPPVGYAYAFAERSFGILTNVPLVWLALAAPLAWRSQSGRVGSVLRWFVMAVALLFGMCALTLGLFYGANFRYDVDFLPALLLLAVVGILGLERALAPTSESGQAPTSESGQADRPVWRRAVRWGWGLLLGFSVAFNLLASAEYYAKTHCCLGVALEESGRVPEAIEQFEQALRIEPDFAEAHNELGLGLGQAGRIQEAISEFEQALRIRPDYVQAHGNMGIVLAQAGRIQEAISEFEQALRLQPNYVQAHINMGIVLEQTGRVQEAIGHYEQALRIGPDSAEVRYNLGMALSRLGKRQEAMEQLEQALRIKPDFTAARNGLARLQGGQ